MDDLKNEPTPALLARALALSRAYAQEEPQDAATEDGEKARLGYYSGADSEMDLVLWELHRRATEDIFEAAMAWAKSGDPIERELAIDILGALGEMGYVDEVRSRKVTPFFPRSSSTLETLLDDYDVHVVCSAVWAFSYNYTPEPVLRRPHLANHPSESIRMQVVHCLSNGLIYNIEAPLAIEWLLRLADDSHEDIRDWATFDLGSMGGHDTQEIRDMLVKRLSDPHQTVRDEAMMGLACRCDQRAIPSIIEALYARPLSDLVIKAAAILGSSEFIEPLKSIEPVDEEDGKFLDEALRNCMGERTDTYDMERLSWRRENPGDG